MEREYTPENISTLKPYEIFVFGSNLAGHHGGGAARAGLFIDCTSRAPKTMKNGSVFKEKKPRKLRGGLRIESPLKIWKKVPS